jgi:hypothetical protein
MSLTLWELRRAAAYSVIVGVLVALVVLVDATLAPASADNQATPTPTPVILPADFRTGPYIDQFGEVVSIEADAITDYSYDQHGGEWLTINGVRYYRSPTGRLVRTADK